MRPKSEGTETLRSEYLGPISPSLGLPPPTNPCGELLDEPPAFWTSQSFPEFLKIGVWEVQNPL